MLSTPKILRENHFKENMKWNEIRLFFPDVECRDFNISNNELESRLEGRKIGAEARFSCPRGFQLAAGPTVVKCQTNGKINIM